jgi:hypothetical protein
MIIDDEDIAEEIKT